MTQTPSSETSDQDAGNRRDRLRARRSRRTRLSVAVLVIAIAGVGATVAYAINLNSTDAHAVGSEPTAPDQSTFGAEGTLVPASVKKAVPMRALDHTKPLKLWIGGDSLAGSFGPALGDRVGATGVVSTVVDYKTSSGLWTNDIRNWYQRATDQMSSDNPDAVVFIIGTNDASIVNGVDSNGDKIPDGTWESEYRLKVDRMMDLLVGPSHRTVFWLGPPTLGTKSLDRGAKALGELMRQEAAKYSPNVTYLDTYKLFSTVDGGYSRTILDENGKEIQARISDGIHFSEDGAQYLARAVFTLIDARWKVSAQADLAQPIGWTNAPGSGEVVPGFSQKPRSRYGSGAYNSSGANSSSGGNGSGNNSGTGSGGGSSTSIPSSDSSTPATQTPSTGAGATTPATSTATTAPHTTPTTAPHTTTT